MFPYIPKKTCSGLRQIKECVPKVIPHKMLYISDYIFSCYAFLSIFDFPNPLSKHILQFHAFFVQTTAAGADTVSSRNDQISTY